MVEIDPLDHNAIRAAREAVRLGKEIIGSVTGGKAEPEDSKQDASGDNPRDASQRPPDQPETVADFSNPTIHAGGNVTINNYVTNMPASPGLGGATDIACCHDYPDGICPHRR